LLGDQRKVTVFGVSAGSAIVDELSLTQNNLFRAAIMQSGTSFLVSGGNLITRNPTVTRPWDILANKTGCAGRQSLSCLQQVPASEIKRVVEEHGLVFLPVFDSGMTVARNEMSSRKAIPLMIGSSYQDGLGAFQENTNIESVVNVLPFGQTIKNNLINRYKTAYPHGPGKEFSDSRYADAGFITDVAFNCVSFLPPSDRIAHLTC
jgi:carboxylesterase type B